ncbi:MAG TPA: DUF4352 domain-containing protein [Anaerolineae bacterium]
MKKQINGRRNILLAPAMVSLAVFIMACGLLSPGTTAPSSPTNAPSNNGQNPQSTQAPAATAAPLPKADTPTKAPSSGASQPGASDAYFGDVFEQDGVTLSVVEVGDPAKVDPAYKVKSGKRIFAVRFVLGNTTRPKLTVQPLNSMLVDDAGNTYKPEFTALKTEIPVIELQPGEHADGWMGYSVPAKATIVSFKYAPDVDSQKNIAIKLMPAPAGHTMLKLASQRAAPKIPALGTKVLANGYSLLVGGVADPATPGILYRPVDGMRLVSMDVAVSNESSADKLFVNPMYFVLVDTTGAVYTSELGGVSGQIEAVDLTQGQIQTGKIAFVVPNDAKLESLRLAPFLRLDFTLQSGLK